VIEHPDGARTPLIDASVHIFFSSTSDLRGFLREPFKSRGFPDYESDWYGAPGGEYAKGTGNREIGYPGSNPEAVADHLFSARGVDVAVLHPMTRGIMPDRHLGSALHAAHNEMMVSRWLESSQFGDRFRGTIRVNPDDVAGALREIDRWRDHPRVVQIGIPLQSRELYGKPQFWPLWEAAAAANLPVAVHIETGEGIAFPPTPSGHTQTYEQYLITPFIWRMDTFGRPHLEQTPWAPRIPSDYLPGHVYFIQGSLDGPGDAEFAGEWFRFTAKDDKVMFGSSYPHWQNADATRLPSALSAEQRDKVCWRNAAELYGIDIPANLAAQ
jgi:predicted TIM-barrel fold metal-dependent hydrolase